MEFVDKALMWLRLFLRGALRTCGRAWVDLRLRRASGRLPGEDVECALTALVAAGADLADAHALAMDLCGGDRWVAAAVLERHIEARIASGARPIHLIDSLHAFPIPKGCFEVPILGRVLERVADRHREAFPVDRALAICMREAHRWGPFLLSEHMTGNRVILRMTVFDLDRLLRILRAALSLPSRGDSDDNVRCLERCLNMVADLDRERRRIVTLQTTIWAAPGLFP